MCRLFAAVLPLCCLTCDTLRLSAGGINMYGATIASSVLQSYHVGQAHYLAASPSLSSQSLMSLYRFMPRQYQACWYKLLLSSNASKQKAEALKKLCSWPISYLHTTAHELWSRQCTHIMTKVPAQSPYIRPTCCTACVHACCLHI